MQTNFLRLEQLYKFTVMKERFCWSLRIQSMSLLLILPKRNIYIHFDNRERDDWLAAIYRAVNRIPARFCLDCSTLCMFSFVFIHFDVIERLIELSLSASPTRAAPVRLAVAGQKIPEERFLVVAAGK